MNLVDAYVVEILDQPHEMYGKWWLEIEYTCEGRRGNSKLMFNTRDEAEDVTAGYHFIT
jgi:hypothetical protein